MPFRIFFLLLPNHFEGGGGAGVKEPRQIRLATALVQGQFPPLLHQALNGNCDVNNVCLFFQIEIWKLGESIDATARRRCESVYVDGICRLQIDEQFFSF